MARSVNDKKVADDPPPVVGTDSNDSGDGVSEADKRLASMGYKPVSIARLAPCPVPHASKPGASMPRLESSSSNLGPLPRLVVVPLSRYSKENSPCGRASALP